MANHVANTVINQLLLALVAWDCWNDGAKVRVVVRTQPATSAAVRAKTTLCQNERHHIQWLSMKGAQMGCKIRRLCL